MSKFEEIGLSTEMLQAIGELGFEQPTPVQERSIPEILNGGRDVISLAQTGTGKTGAFGLPIIQLADDQTAHTQALVLCPTRELCLQITKDLKAFAKYRERVQIVPVYGGSDIRTQIKALRGPAHIVVGTPGRVIDLMNRGSLNIGEIRWLILDEADEMLNMGFKDDLETILAETPETRQTMLFSATMPPFIAKIANSYMNDPIKISIGKTNQGADTVEHQYYQVKASDRYLALKRIVDIVPDIYGIVFCRTREETKDVADKLIADGYNADALHGDLSQAQRDMVMQRFRMRHLQLLVATDVAARGIDVNNLTHVINYNLPDDPEVYIHRSGRTGRAGKEGISISIVHSRELGKIRQIEKMSNKKFERCLVPTAEEVCKAKLQHFIDEIEKQEVDETSAVSQFLPGIMERLSKFSSEELINKFVAREFETVNSYYQNAADLNVYDRKQLTARANDGSYMRLFINMGKMDRLRPGDLMSIVNGFMRHVDDKIAIGHIDIMRNFSFIEVDAQYGEQVIAAMNGQVLNGYKLIVEQAQPRDGGDNSERRRKPRRSDNKPFGRGDRDRDRDRKRDSHRSKKSEDWSGEPRNRRERRDKKFGRR
ncbi:MAG: DEAD/DEAH box helicase [Bacteroidales bacterium]|nr:DEAD/DEAH box helicase [Bacteroidales bacterium]